MEIRSPSNMADIYPPMHVPQFGSIASAAHAGRDLIRPRALSCSGLDRTRDATPIRKRHQCEFVQYSSHGVSNAADPIVSRAQNVSGEPTEPSRKDESIQPRHPSAVSSLNLAAQQLRRSVEQTSSSAAH